MSFVHKKPAWRSLYKRTLRGNVDNIAIVRIEQLFPFPQKQMFEIKAKYFNAKHWLWVQECPNLLRLLMQEFHQPVSAYQLYVHV